VRGGAPTGVHKPPPDDTENNQIFKEAPVPTVSMKELLQSGVHFGHQTRRWNPKMKSYIFAERGGIYIIDLQKTSALIDEAYAFLRNVTSRGGSVLFVGTKKQCQDTIREEAERVGQPYVAARWLGGLLTNFATLSKRIKRLHELRKLVEDGSIDVLPKREQISMRGELAKLETNLGGVAGMERLPDAVFVVDPRKEAIVVREARKLGIPLVGLVDTNCDPDEIDYVIPGNDDAIRSCSLIARVVARAVEEGRQKVAEAEFKAAAEKAAQKAAERAAEAAERAAEAAERAAEAAEKHEPSLAQAAPASGRAGAGAPAAQQRTPSGPRREGPGGQRREAQRGERASRPGDRPSPATDRPTRTTAATDRPTRTTAATVRPARTTAATHRPARGQRAGGAAAPKAEPEKPKTEPVQDVAAGVRAAAAEASAEAEQAPAGDK